MSACAIKQWGHGTPCVKEGGAAKEMAAKLAQIKAERDRQDAAWVLTKKDTINSQALPSTSKNTG
jgi:hypothetical protein